MVSEQEREKEKKVGSSTANAAGLHVGHTAASHIGTYYRCEVHALSRTVLYCTCTSILYVQYQKHTEKE